MTTLASSPSPSPQIFASSPLSSRCSTPLFRSNTSTARLSSRHVATSNQSTISSSKEHDHQLTSFTNKSSKDCRDYRDIAIQYSPQDFPPTAGPDYQTHTTTTTSTTTTTTIITKTRTLPLHSQKTGKRKEMETDTPVSWPSQSRPIQFGGRSSINSSTSSHSSRANSAIPPSNNSASTSASISTSTPNNQLSNSNSNSTPTSNSTSTAPSHSSHPSHTSHPSASTSSRRQSPSTGSRTPSSNPTHESSSINSEMPTRMPREYMRANPMDLGAIISDMLLELILINDAVPPRSSSTASIATPSGQVPHISSSVNSSNTSNTRSSSNNASNNSSNGMLTRFHSRAPPAISVRDYLNRLIFHATLSPSLLLAMVYYIDKLCAMYPAFTINSLTVHRFLITAATVAAKGLSDSFWTNHTYARVGGVGTHELAMLELDFLSRLDWEIVPKAEVLEDYYRSLVARAGHFEMESDLQDGDQTANTSQHLEHSRPASVSVSASQTDESDRMDES